MTETGRNKIFEETFVSPFEKETKAGALKVLDEIRKVHNPESGWVEMNAYVEQLPNGRWRAVRQHAQYK